MWVLVTKAKYFGSAQVTIIKAENTKELWARGIKLDAVHYKIHIIAS